MTVFTEKRLSASSVGIDKGGSKTFQGSISRTHRLFSAFSYTSEARSLHPKENSSPPVLATIHQNAATWGWGRGVAGFHSLWVHRRVIASVPRATLRTAFQLFFSWTGFDLVGGARSTIQDTDQRWPEQGESQKASLKIWARKMKIETFKCLYWVDEQTVGDKILAFPELE